MLTPEQVRERLQDRKINKVSEATGIHMNTIYRIRRGEVDNPSAETLRILSAYLEGRTNG